MCKCIQACNRALRSQDMGQKLFTSSGKGKWRRCTVGMRGPIEPVMLCNYCPFCGVKYPVRTREPEVENEID